MHQHKGFLYGHYDSRGGTTFIEANTRDEADRRYGEVFGYSPEETKEFNPGGNDFIGEAVLSSPSPLEDEEDLEMDGAGKVLVLGGDKVFDADRSEDDNENFGVEEAFLDALEAMPKPLNLLYIPEGDKFPTEPAFHPSWDDDAFAFIFMPLAPVGA